MAYAEYSVLTPERVSLQYDIAGIGSRGAAAIVDSLIQLLAIVVVFIGLSGTVAAATAFVPAGGSAAAGLLIGLMSLGAFLVIFGYYMLFEILWNGQSPGKRLLGLRVIRENGYPIRPVDAVIRNLVRVVDFLPAYYGVGVAAMLLNNRSKRLGDFAAGTIVVREGSRGTVASLFIAPPGSDSAPAPSVRLSNADATLVRDFLTRRATMNAHARAQLAQRLANALSARYALNSQDSDPEQFLEELSA